MYAALVKTEGREGMGYDPVLQDGRKNGAAALKELIEQGREGRCLFCLPLWFTVSVVFRFDNF